MTFHAGNPTFAQQLAQTLVSRGLGFTFYKSPGCDKGEFAFHVQDDRTADIVRSLATDWGVMVYEIQDRDQPSRD